MVGAGSPETPSGDLRRLSAADTDFQKVWVLLFGGLWLVCVSVAAFAGRDPRIFLMVGLSALVLGLAAWQVFRLNVVETDGTTLFVSTFFSTMSLPLTWVESVDGGLWPFSRTATIRLRQVTPFGETVSFQPKSGFWTGQNGVEELRALVAQANLGRAPGSALPGREPRRGSRSS